MPVKEEPAWYPFSPQFAVLGPEEVDIELSRHGWLSLDVLLIIQKTQNKLTAEPGEREGIYSCHSGVRGLGTNLSSQLHPLHYNVANREEWEVTLASVEARV